MIAIVLRVLGILMLVPGLGWNNFGLDKWFDPHYKLYVFGLGVVLYLAGAITSQFQRNLIKQKSSKEFEDDQSEGNR